MDKHNIYQLVCQLYGCIAGTLWFWIAVHNSCLFPTKAILALYSSGLPEKAIHCGRNLPPLWPRAIFTSAMTDQTITVVRLSPLISCEVLRYAHLHDRIPTYTPLIRLTMPRTCNRAFDHAGCRFRQAIFLIYFLCSETTSLSSSIYRELIENGRR